VEENSADLWGVRDMDKTLDQLLEEARKRKMSPKEREEQRINFAYGNAADGDNSTIDTVKAASKIEQETKP
jgi:hypothetical protein